MKEPVFIIKKIKRRVSWTPHEDELLLSLTTACSKNSWKTISENFQGKSSYHCFLRYRSIRPGLKKGNWEKEEDERVLIGVKTFGKKWHLIAKHYFWNRNAKQVRDRYINYLDPSVRKGKFSEDEDRRIYQLHSKYGNQWSLIQKQFPERTADAIKNRYNSSLKRKGKELFNYSTEEVSISHF
jgi:hypothetical protein